ncbi:MAG TPA: hypothetical protein VLY24_26325 [Bryobacteraceae bacterium]|nr:hypothetical protein [Bryobacteraceae bacterium]
MTRRDFLGTAAIATSAPSATELPVTVPVRRIVDARAKCTPEQLNRFWWHIWPQAVRDFNRCGIRLQTSDAAGEIRRSAGDRPIFIGLERGVVNLILTDHLPLYWDNSRALAGVTTIHEGYHLSMLALRYAHGHQVPFVSVNTCVHELLHALMQDVFVRNPSWNQIGEREFRIDAFATSLWLFRSGAAIRKSARAYVARLSSAAPAHAEKFRDG